MSVEAGDRSFDQGMVDNGGAPAAGGGGAVDPRAQGWKQDVRGRWITPARGRSGMVYRQGNETIEEALARDKKGPKDKRPKSKPKTAPKPPAPTQESLKELEFLLAEGLKSLAVPCAMLGDSWPADHFTLHGPILARNLVEASKHNPWLRSKLEAAVRGEDFMVKVITTLGIGGALCMYAVPPILYYLPGVAPKEARELFDVPDRRELHAARTAQRAAEDRAEQERARAQAAEAEAAAAAAAVAAAA